MTDKDIIKTLEIIEADLRATRNRLRRQGWHSQLSLKTIYLVSDILVEISNRQDETMEAAENPVLAPCERRHEVLP